MMKTAFEFFLGCMLIMAVPACTKEFGDEPMTRIRIQTDLSELGLPAGAALNWQNARLSMDDRNKWFEKIEISITDLDQPVLVRSSVYSNMLFSADLLYAADGTLHSQRVQAYVSGSFVNGYDAFGEEVTAVFQLEKK